MFASRLQSEPKLFHRRRLLANGLNAIVTPGQPTFGQNSPRLSAFDPYKPPFSTEIGQQSFGRRRAQQDKVRRRDLPASPELGSRNSRLGHAGLLNNCLMIKPSTTQRPAALILAIFSISLLGLWLQQPTFMRSKASTPIQHLKSC